MLTLECRNTSEGNRRGMMAVWMKAAAVTMMRMVRWQTYFKGTAQGELAWEWCMRETLGNFLSL